MGGPPVSEEMERLIIDTWRDIVKSGYRSTAKEVRFKVIQICEKKDYSISEIPTLRTFQEKIKLARKQQLPLNESNEHTTWSMATLNDFPLHPECIPYVLQLWRYSVALDVDFTIRQAKWASRLYTHEQDITKLWFSSRRYSDEEELSILTKLPMRTFRLDSKLVMGLLEHRTALHTGYPYAFETYDHRHFVKRSILPHGEDGGIAEELIHALPFFFWLDVTDETEYKRIHEIYHLIKELPSSSLYFKDLETRMIYLRQLSYISKGPKWTTLTPHEIRDIIVELRDWVIKMQNDIDDSEFAQRTSKDFGTYLKNQQTLNEFPSHLYIRAGYTQYSSKGGKNARTHNKKK